MRAQILLFALARERAGASSLTVDLAPGATVGDLKAALSRECPALKLLVPILRIAIDSEYALSDSDVIPEGSELAAIPPVSGGSPLPAPWNR